MAVVYGPLVSLVVQNTVAWLFDTSGSNQTIVCDVIYRVLATTGTNRNSQVGWREEGVNRLERGRERERERGVCVCVCVYV